LQTSQIKSFGGFLKSIKNNELIDVEFLITFVMISSIPSLVLNLPQVSHFHFLNFEFLICASFLLTLTISFSNKLNQNWVIVNNNFQKGNRVLIRVTIIIISLSTMLNIAQSFMMGVGFNVRNRALMITETSDDIAPIDSLNISLTTLDPALAFRTFSMLYSSKPNDAIKEHNSYNLLNSLLELGKVQNSERKATLLFIPQSDSLYWNLMNKNKNIHRISSFIAGELSGVGLIDGMPPKDSLDWDWTGFASYEFREAIQTEKDCSDETLCKKLQKEGFLNLITINSETGDITKIECADVFINNY